MNIDLITKDDLQTLKEDIITGLKSLLAVSSNEHEWLKTNEVRELLKCSYGTLQNLRITGQLKHSKINGTIYYNRKEVMNLFESNSL